MDNLQDLYDECNNLMGYHITIVMQDGSTVDVHTITGVVVRKGVDLSDALQDLPRGIYIVGGKKCLIK